MEAEKNYKLNFTVPLSEEQALHGSQVSWEAGGIPLNSDLLPYSNFIAFNKLIEVCRVKDSRGGALTVKQVFDLIGLSKEEKATNGIELTFETDHHLKEFFEKYHLQPENLLECILSISKIDDLKSVFNTIKKWYSINSTYDFPKWKEFQKRQVHLPLVGYYIGCFIDADGILDITYALRDCNQEIKKKLEKGKPMDSKPLPSHRSQHLFQRIPAHLRRVAKPSKAHLSLVS